MPIPIQPMGCLTGMFWKFVLPTTEEVFRTPIPTFQLRLVATMLQNPKQHLSIDFQFSDTSEKKVSKVINTSTLGMSVFSAIRDTKSAFLIIYIFVLN